MSADHEKARKLAEKIGRRAACAHFDCGDSGHHAVTENEHKRMESFAAGVVLPYATALLAAEDAVNRAESFIALVQGEIPSWMDDDHNWTEFALSVEAALSAIKELLP